MGARDCANETVVDVFQFEAQVLLCYTFSLALPRISVVPSLP